MTTERDPNEWAMETLARSAVHQPDKVDVRLTDDSTSADAKVRVSYVGKNLAPWVGSLYQWNLAVEAARAEWERMNRNRPRILVSAVDGSP